MAWDIFWLWYSRQRWSACASIIRKGSSDIHWGLGTWVHWGGVSTAFKDWNLVSIRFRGSVCVIIKGKARCHHRYPPWQRVGCHSNRAWRKTWSEEKFWGYKCVPSWTEGGQNPWHNHIKTTSLYPGGTEPTSVGDNNRSADGNGPGGPKTRRKKKSQQICW